MQTTLSKVRAEYWGKHHSRTLHMGRVLRLLAGLFLLCLASVPFFDFPVVQIWLLPLGIIYLLLLAAIPRLWLLVLPVATVLLDITPWTGRFTYNEFDFLLLLTISSGLIYGRYRWSVFTPTPAMGVMLAYLAVVMVGYAGWSYLVLVPTASLDNPYYSAEYSYKVAKGLFWGVALVPMWGYALAHNKRRATNALVTGASIAALVLGVLVLWERGVFGALLGGSSWGEIVQSLLDLSQSYRVTGLFSDMHTGGEVVDGLVLLLLPATLYGILHRKRNRNRLVSVAAFLFLAYVALVGTTLVTYLAFALGAAAFTGMSYWYLRRAGESVALSLPWLAAAFGVGTVVAIAAYQLAGGLGLVSFGALLALAYTATQLPPTRQIRTGLRLVALALIAFAVWAHFSSVLVESSVVLAMLMALGLVLAFLVGEKAFGESTGLVRFERLLLLGATVALPALVALALVGNQMENRFGHLAATLEERQNHYAQVIDSSGDGFWTMLFGNGVGSFPGKYVDAHSGRVSDVGSFSIYKDGPRYMLQLGGGKDLVLAQRVSITPDTLYTVSLRLRVWHAGGIEVGLCERNILYGSSLVPNCERKVIMLEPSDDQFQDYAIELSSEDVGASGALSGWPEQLVLRYPGDGQILEVDSVELTDENGFNRLQNGSFGAGLDNWLYYNDHSHLPWHVKNQFLQVWFETGWLGLLLFLALLALFLKSAFTSHAVGSLEPVYIVGVSTVCLLGLVASPLDSARVSWLFYFYLFSGLATLRASPQVHRGRRKRRASSG